METFFEYSEKEIAHLKKRDKRLGTYIDSVGAIKRRINPDLFCALVQSIISQQISGKAADTVCGRLASACDMTPQGIMSLSKEGVKACGTSMRKAEYILNAAVAFSENPVFVRLGDLPDDEAIKTLTSIKGVGVWTAEMLLIFSLARKDVVSFGDLGIKRGIMRLYGLDTLSPDAFEKYRKRYSPFGTVASFYLWEIAGNV